MDNLQLDFLKKGCKDAEHHLYQQGGELKIVLALVGEVLTFNLTDRQSNVVEEANRKIEWWNFNRRKATKLKRIVIPESLQECTNQSLFTSLI